MECLDHLREGLKEVNTDNHPLFPFPTPITGMGFTSEDVKVGEERNERVDGCV